MHDIEIGSGDLNGKGAYAARDFKKGEVVIKYNLQELTFEQYKNLPEPEKSWFTHARNGKIFLYPEPERYVNSSKTPNMYVNLAQGADIALRDIKKGEKITIDNSVEDVPLLKRVDAVLVKVPSIQEGLDFYFALLGHAVIWKTDEAAAMRLGNTELVLSTKSNPETDILVESVPHAVEVIVKAGGKVIFEPNNIPVGMVAVVQDPFGNTLTLVDLSKGTYQTDDNGDVTGVAK